MAKEYVCLYHSFLDVIQPLNDEERGRLLTAILVYGKTGVPPEMPGNERFVFPAIRSQIDRDAEKYTERCKKNAQNVTNRWNGPRSDDTNVYEPVRNDTIVYDRIRSDTNAYETYQDKDKDKCKDKGKGDIGSTGAQSAPTRTRFQKPTFEQVEAYCRERGNSVDAQRFVDYYESNGWRVGKNPMRDWKSAVRTWERSNANFSAARPTQPQSSGNVFFDMLREESGF